MQSSTTGFVLPEPIALGPFELQQVMGRGGMGTVWRGLHVEQDVPVAIKVLRARFAHSDTYLSAFRDEVRRVAEFTHPGIVMVFDYGRLPDVVADRVHAQLDDQRLAEFRLDADSPYLVMEYCEGGTLSERGNRLFWAGVRGVLLAILDALAHAHARGVIHRDIKPDNVLFTSPDGMTPVVKLTDFGVALAENDETLDTGYRIAGTLQYMAPEQFGDWRDLGPWTDLYAVGCLGHELVAGKPPFIGRHLSGYMRLHTTAVPPPLPLRDDIPPAFEGWLLKLLQKDPRHRFACAADAAAALVELGGGVEPASLPFTVKGSTLPVLDPGEQDTLRVSDPSGIPSVCEDSPTMEDLDGIYPRAPFPRSWRRSQTAPAAMKLVGTGMGLYEWRTIPFVGRDRERSELWDALRRVDETGLAELVLLEGDAGLGKSRLGEWLQTRALEVGAATVSLSAEHNPIAGPSDGLAQAVARLLRCSGLRDEMLRERVHRVLVEHGEAGRYERDALVDLLTTGSRSATWLGTPTQRYVLLRRVLETLARHRPLILRLEDVQWGGDALGFAQHLMSTRRQQPFPILVVMSARSELLAARPLESEMCHEILQLEGAQRIEVGALSGAEHADLVRGLLRLEGDLADQVITRTHGNPLFAIQLVGDWVRRKVLEVGPTGFVLSPGEEARIPARIHLLWEGRVGLVLAGQPLTAAIALQAAAALGLEVDAGEWSAVCDIQGVPVPTTLVESLMRARLAEPRATGWAFGHGMLRESVQQQAEDDGTWAEVNRSCVAMLQQRAGARGVDERIGRHLVEAGEHEPSLAPLLAGARQQLQSSDYRPAGQLLDLRERMLGQLAVPETDPRWGEQWVERLRVHIGLGDFDAAEHLATRTAEVARKRRWKHIYPRALRFQAMTVQKRSGLGLAETVLIRAQMEATRSGDREEEGRCLLHLSNVSRLLGEPDRALEYCEQGFDVFESIGDEPGMASCLAEIGNAHLAAGDVDEARQRLERARTLFEALGNQFGIASCANSLAEIDRRQGRLAEAEARYRQAQEMCDRMGSPERTVCLINRCLIQLELADFRAARALIEAGLRTAVAQERFFSTYFHTALLPCLAHARQWRRWDRHLRLAGDLVSESGTVDPDIAGPAQLAGDLALAASEGDRAAEAYALALEQWEALEQPARVDEIRAALARCAAAT